VITLQERPGLVVLTIELEGALAQMPGSLSPSRMWSPYRQPLAKFLNKYSADVSQSGFGSCALKLLMLVWFVIMIMAKLRLQCFALSTHMLSFRHAIHHHVLKHAANICPMLKCSASGP